jgi:cell cycle sensor histidine kinase DivJ
LNAVIGFSEAITSESYGPLGHQKYAEYAAIIRSSGGHLLDLVNSILDLARIEAGRMTLKRERTDVRALAGECAAMMRLEAEKSGLALNVRVDDDVPECFVDPRAVRQILINLLSNAVKFTADGAIGLVLYKDRSDVVIAVADTGVGMSEEEIARLGLRFAATKGEGLRGAKSAGLGLALAMALADLHGGKMTLKSAPGEGLVATVRLPIGAPAAPRRKLKAVDGGLASRPAAPPPDILTQLERIEAYRRDRASAA